MHRRLARHPAAVARTAPLAKELAFPLRTARPRLPKLQPPEGHTLMSWLRELAYQGAAERYRLPEPEITARPEKALALGYQFRHATLEAALRSVLASA